MLDLNTVDWKTLPFGYYDTDYNVRCYCRDGQRGRVVYERQRLRLGIGVLADLSGAWYLS